MAASIIGYPQETYFCPACGSGKIDTRDMWDQDGLTVCKECGCRCYIIQAEEEEGESTNGKEENPKTTNRTDQS